MLPVSSRVVQHLKSDVFPLGGGDAGKRLSQDGWTADPARPPRADISCRQLKSHGEQTELQCARTTKEGHEAKNPAA